MDLLEDKLAINGSNIETVILSDLTLLDINPLIIYCIFLTILLTL